MRVLFLHDRIRTGGSERNTIDLMRALAAIGVEPHICLAGRGTEGPLAAELESSGIPIHRLDGARIYDVRAMWRLVRLLRRQRFDIIHLEDPYPALQAALVRLLLPIPVVVTRHVLDDDRSSHWSGLRARVLNAAMRLASDRAIVLAGPLRAPFARQSGIAAERMVVVPNGIRPWLDPRGRRHELRRSLGWHEGQKVILLVAVLRGGKGHEDMFAAMPDLIASVSGVRCCVVGDGPMRTELEERARPHGSRVVFMGERIDVPDLMAAADLLVLPSWSEAYPTVLLEAAMAGLPAVATDVGGSAEIVSDGETGLIVPAHAPDRLAEAIIAILGDSDWALALGRAARRRAEAEFTIERQAERTLELYSELVSTVAPPQQRPTERLGSPRPIDAGAQKT